jgi:hypothetical protein
MIIDQHVQDQGNTFIIGDGGAESEAEELDE